MVISDYRIVVVGNPWKNWIFVILETSEGMVGIGEATGGLHTQAVVADIHELARFFIGQDPLAPQVLWNHLYEGFFLKAGPAIAGIESACWDILAKSLHVPAYQLWGGRRNPRIRAYANGWYQGPRNPDAFAERALAVVGQGYTALKFDPFGAVHGTLSRKEFELSMAIVDAVHRAVSGQADIIIEAHDRFDVETAIRVGRALEKYNPLWYETPVLSGDFSSVAAVTQRVPVTVAVGERMTELYEVTEVIRRGGVGVLNLEFLSLGGVWRMIQAAHSAGSAGVQVAPHSAQGPVCTAINLHIDTALDNVLIQEYFEDYNDAGVRSVIQPSWHFENGYLELNPDIVGFGVSLDEERAKQFPYDPHAHLRLFEAGWEWRRQEHPS